MDNTASKDKISKNTETAAKQNQACTVFKKHPLSILVKSFKPRKINLKTANKKLVIKKHRNCGITTTAQNQAGTVVFKKQPLLTTCEKLQNSKNQVKNCKQKIVGLVLETEVPGKK